MGLVSLSWSQRNICDRGVLNIDTLMRRIVFPRALLSSKLLDSIREGKLMLVQIQAKRHKQLQKDVSSFTGWNNDDCVTAHPDQVSV